MTTLVKCRFCLHNGHNEVAIPDGEPVRCTFCKRVQPLPEKEKVERVRREPPPIEIPENLFK